MLKNNLWDALGIVDQIKSTKFSCRDSRMTSNENALKKKKKRIKRGLFAQVLIWWLGTVLYNDFDV